MFLIVILFSFVSIVDVDDVVVLVVVGFSWYLILLICGTSLVIELWQQLNAIIHLIKFNRAIETKDEKLCFGLFSTSFFRV